MPKLLNFKGRKLKAFPKELLEHPTLTNLNLDDNEIAEIPDWIVQLKDLKVIYLSNNQISNIDLLLNLKNLCVLHLNSNKIKTLPTVPYDWPKLERLYLNDNEITYLPDALSRLPNLRHLLVAQNHLKDINPRITQLNELTVLNCFDNELEYIPFEIRNLKKLEYLQISANKLTALPASIGELKSLTTLEFYSNKIEEIPVEISNLINLRSLNLADNKINIIPVLPKKVGKISLYLNPISNIDHDIVNGFKAMKKRNGFDFLFVDSKQFQCFELRKEDFVGQTLKILDLDKMSMSFFSRKYVPLKIIEKYKLKSEGFGGKR